MNKLRFVLSPLLAIALVLGVSIAAVQSAPGGAKAAQAQENEPSGKDVQPTVEDGNPECAEGQTGLKVEPEEGEDELAEGEYSDDTLTVQISNIRDNRLFDWSHVEGPGVNAVIVKGGPNANVYTYSPPEEDGDTDLHAPVNPNSGQYYELSHVTFCYGEEEPPGTCPSAISLSPAEDENPVNSDHTVTATVTDENGNACGAGIDVLFEVSSDGNPNPDSATVPTDENGQAEFTYTNDTAGTDTITACTSDDGTAPETCDDEAVTIVATAEKTWVECHEEAEWILGDIVERNRGGTEDGSAFLQNQLASNVVHNVVENLVPNDVAVDPVNVKQTVQRGNCDVVVPVEDLVDSTLG